MSGITSGATLEHNRFEPTPEGWEAFRRAVKAGQQPVMGNVNYHLRLPLETKIKDFEIDSEQVSVNLNDGRVLQTPLFWFPILRDATEEERQDFEIDRSGRMVWFNRLNTEILIDYLFCLKTFADEMAFLNMCASSKNLLSDIAVLVWRSAKEQDVSIDAVLEQLKAKLEGWPSPKKA